MELGQRRWLLILALIAAGGLALRLIYIHVHTQSISELSDAYYYHGGANLLAEGRGFIDSNFLALDGRELPAATHPPGYLVVLAAASLVGFKNFMAHEIWSAIIGTGTIVAIGFAGRRLAGPRVGLLAAVVAAVYPNFWFTEAQVMSETLVLLLATITILLAYRCWDRPTVPRVGALALAVGLTALTRAEALLLGPLLILPLTLLVPGLAARRRLALLAVGTGVVVLTMAPWVVHNLSRFDRPVFLSASDHTLLAGNCQEVYEGPLIGYWTVGCITEVNCPDLAERREDPLGCLADIPLGQDASVQQEEYRRAALDNIRDNLRRMPLVVLAREGRAWGFFQPLGQLRLDTFSSRELELSRIGLGIYYALAVGTVAGCVVLRRRRVPVFPLLSFVATVTVAVAVTFGETRYRALVEPVLALGAAVALDAALDALHRRGKRLRPGMGPSGDQEVDGGSADLRVLAGQGTVVKAEGSPSVAF
jgi:4-amino-4-deoxy-L-arabinose transferase-like glycosyltransferase